MNFPDHENKSFVQLQADTIDAQRRKIRSFELRLTELRREHEVTLRLVAEYRSKIEALLVDPRFSGGGA